MAKAKRFWYSKIRWLNVTRLMARDVGNCAICGSQLNRKLRDHDHPLYVTFDHIVPRSRGGGNELGNLRLAHSSCNSARGNDPLIEEGA